MSNQTDGQVANGALAVNKSSHFSSTDSKLNAFRPETLRPETFRVVVAEDDAVFRRVIAFTLERAGFDVSPVANGQLAWELLQAGRVDCLVTDHQMPQLSGIELIAKTRGDERLRSLPIVLCTAKGLELDSEYLIRRYDLSAVLHKPFSPRKLADLLQDCCQV